MKSPVSPILLAILAERATETRERTVQRSQRYVQTMVSQLPASPQDTSLTIGRNSLPPLSGHVKCSRCDDLKAPEELAKKDAKTLRTYCKKCHAKKTARFAAKKAQPLTIGRNSLPPLSEDADWQARVAAKRERLVARTEARVARTLSTDPYEFIRCASSAETARAVGQASGWLREVPVYGEHRIVANQIARLCGDDSEVKTSYRSLADATQRTKAAVEVAVEHMTKLGWLTTAPSPSGTTFSLMPGSVA